jgi:DNA mismatch endonuclease (patch repair protein)
MRATRRADTAPEMTLRRALHARGLRFFKNRRPELTLRSAADLVFPRVKVCVFVDGCYWHGCPLHFRKPRRNADWWQAKIDGNRARDERHTRALSDHGWHVIRVWEHELKGETLASVVDRVIQAVGTRRTRK